MEDKLEIPMVNTSALIRSKESSRKKDSRKSSTTPDDRLQEAARKREIRSRTTPDAKLQDAARKREARRSLTPDARLKESCRKRARRTSLTPDARSKEAERKREQRKSLSPLYRTKQSERKKRQRRLSALVKASKPLPVEDDINSALRSCYASTILDDDDNLDAILEKHIPTDDDISSGLRRLQTEMRADQKMFICGSCGIRDFEGATSFVPFAILQPDQLTLYRVRDPLLCDDSNTIVYVMEDESWYHLHPNIDTDTLMICSSCKDYVVKKEAVPPWSLAGGCDYGQIPDELRSLSTVESMVISQVIPFGTLIKLSADGGCRLKGHIISFQHQTSSELGRLPNVSCLADRLIVQFSGTRNQLLLL